ncbi:hypothetical protein AMK19_02520 [Kitasatospora sp. CB01950]|nr:hypothetical protein AMK19_02520 [Kitasatospora sp. CB01950]
MTTQATDTATGDAPRTCCLCSQAHPDLTVASVTERPSGPPIEYWACPPCKPVVASLGQP